MKIVIIDDDERLLKNLALLLDGETGIEVVGTFQDAESALRDLPLLEVDVVLLDINLPGMTGVELVKKLRPHLKSEFMMHSVRDDPAAVFEALRVGATGYIQKGASPRELIEAIQDLNNGGSPMSPRIARLVISAFQSIPSANQDLTSTEIKVLREIDRGLSYREVGEILQVSVNTVHSHVKNIYRKLEAGSRAEAIGTARRRGLV